MTRNNANAISIVFRYFLNLSGSYILISLHRRKRDTTQGK